MSAPIVVRRRALCILAAGAGLSLTRAAAHDSSTTTAWRGSVLGGPASMTLVHEDRALALRTVTDCEREIARLEGIFSLYRRDSALVRLNRMGALAAPPQELVELLGFALELARRSGGSFDPTLQPLYRLYADHFAAPHAAPAGPPPGAIERTLRRVDHRAVQLEADRIVLTRPGMALTLNGVAQGYLTDRVVDRLHAAGFDSVLIDLGEARALGQHADGSPWRAAVADPRADSGATLFEVSLGGAAGAFEALATSSGRGTVFGTDPRVHHLLDPHTGRSANHLLSVTVSAPRATIADGLSTALAIMVPADHQALLRSFGPVRAWRVDHDDGIDLIA